MRFIDNNVQPLRVPLDHRLMEDFGLAPELFDDTVEDISHTFRLPMMYMSDRGLESGPETEKLDRYRAKWVFRPSDLTIGDVLEAVDRGRWNASMFVENDLLRK